MGAAACSWSLALGEVFLRAPGCSNAEWAQTLGAPALPRVLERMRRAPAAQRQHGRSGGAGRGRGPRSLGAELLPARTAFPQ